MKNKLKNIIKLFIAFSGFAFLLVSCNYQEVADADYPAQKLYMPTAVNGIFTIDDVPQSADFLPTPGQPYKYTIDVSSNKLIVPLGVYRAGLNRSGNVTANIAASNDTIGKLIADSIISPSTIILPASNYTIPSSVDIVSGSEFGTFNLEIDLNYLRSFPNTIFALGIGISSSQVQVNPLLNTTVLVIETKFLKSVASFKSKVDASDSQKIAFTNTSTYALNYGWNFGDGSTASTELFPSHVYTSSGTYTVTLTSL